MELITLRQPTYISIQDKCIKILKIKGIISANNDISEKLIVIYCESAYRELGEWVKYKQKILLNIGMVATIIDCDEIGN